MLDQSSSNSSRKSPTVMISCSFNLAAHSLAFSSPRWAAAAVARTKSSMSLSSEYSTSAWFGAFACCCVVSSTTSLVLSSGDELLKQIFRQYLISNLFTHICMPPCVRLPNSQCICKLFVVSLLFFAYLRPFINRSNSCSASRSRSSASRICVSSISRRRSASSARSLARLSSWRNLCRSVSEVVSRRHTSRWLWPFTRLSPPESSFWISRNFRFSSPVIQCWYRSGRTCSSI